MCKIQFFSNLHHFSTNVENVVKPSKMDSRHPGGVYIYLRHIFSPYNGFRISSSNTAMMLKFQFLLQKIHFFIIFLIFHLNILDPILVQIAYGKLYKYIKTYVYVVMNYLQEKADVENRNI